VAPGEFAAVSRHGGAFNWSESAGERSRASPWEMEGEEDEREELTELSSNRQHGLVPALCGGLVSYPCADSETG
jgi:hypothetical protein